ncbi:MAG TPA: indolepyruvate ferredoxin oxidoreductase subunit alpha [Candidatus Omnitrophota bacterium]|nr:indolepyruvate ferredoxin oxidoreductase subunit alpha [Candidatus Omnitrophota bacterium]HPT08022.1 indolepyruvate ferredoxin oxidoreductase subunit alpha [Candidatus Omnitrophota bacterium]
MGRNRYNKLIMSSSKHSHIALLSGDEALAQGAYEAGLSVAASYPGTPATEILEYLSRFSEVNTQWSVNEKVAFEVALAASIAGVRSLFSAKHVGFNVAMDPLMTSAYTGVGRGFVIVSGDDPGLHSSQNEQDNRWIARMAKLPLLEPASPAEAKEFAKKAFEISEQFDIPVMVRMTTRICHTKENVLLAERVEAPKKEFKINVPKYVMVPRNAYVRHIDLEKRMIALQKYSERTPLNKVELKNKNIGIITSGISYMYAKETYPEASFLKLGFSYPLPEKKIRDFCKKVKRVYVIEELDPILEHEIRALGVTIKAKDASFRVGELLPELIPLIVQGKKRPEEVSTTRKPVLCPGCPHRQTFWLLKKLKLTVNGDIGCYTLGALPPLGSLHTCLCMGSGVTFMEGFGKAGQKPAVGIIGDSTFVHSGITGLINAAYNKAKGLLIIVDNATTAMTGNQPHPATGVTITGEPTKKLVLEDICTVCGADHVDVVNPYSMKEFEALIKQRIAEDALSVIISRYPCRLIERTKAAMPVYVKEACKKCGICLTINCPSITRQEDGTIDINKNMCTGCNLCAEVCIPGAIRKS